MTQQALFGTLAVKSGDVTRDQLDECLEIQEFTQESGTPAKLGTIMLEMGYMRKIQVSKILKLQEFMSIRNRGIQMAQKAVREGILKDRYLQPCLDYQKELFTKQGEIKPLEEILVERRLVSSRTSTRMKRITQDQ